MKRTYVRPTMVGERFVANEYVAACHDQNTVYKFKCDAPGGWLYQVDGYIIIQGLMERLMEYTIKTIELNF